MDYLIKAGYTGILYPVNIICNVTEENPFDDFVWSRLITLEVSEYLNISSAGMKPLVATIANPGVGISDTGELRWRTLLEKREVLASKGIAVFSSVRSAATALSKLVNYCINRERMRTEVRNERFYPGTAEK